MASSGSALPCYRAYFYYYILQCAIKCLVPGHTGADGMRKNLLAVRVCIHVFCRQMRSRVSACRPILPVDFSKASVFVHCWVRVWSIIVRVCLFVCFNTKSGSTWYSVRSVRDSERGRESEGERKTRKVRRN